jgi:hypothetical protein
MPQTDNVSNETTTLVNILPCLMTLELFIEENATRLESTMWSLFDTLHNAGLTIETAIKPRYTKAGRIRANIKDTFKKKADMSSVELKVWEDTSPRYAGSIDALNGVEESSKVTYKMIFGADALENGLGE